RVMGLDTGAATSDEALEALAEDARNAGVQLADRVAACQPPASYRRQRVDRRGVGSSGAGTFRVAIGPSGATRGARSRGWLFAPWRDRSMRIGGLVLVGALIVVAGCSTGPGAH